MSWKIFIPCTKFKGVFLFFAFFVVCMCGETTNGVLIQILSSLDN